MKKTVKSLAYALDRDLKRDQFVFRRTARTVVSMLETSSFSIETLEIMENLLIEKDIFTDEGLAEFQLESLFGASPYSICYSVNLEAGLKLLEAIRNKKEAIRPPL